jgi:hypothetical protein
MNLHSDRRLIVATLRGSSTHRAQEVADLVDRALLHSEKRARRGPENAKLYASKVEAGIRAAVGTMPARGVKIRPNDVLDAIAWRGPEFFGLRRIPALATVERVVAQMNRKAISLLVDPAEQRRDHMDFKPHQGQT